MLASLSKPVALTSGYRCTPFDRCSLVEVVQGVLLCDVQRHAELCGPLKLNRAVAEFASEQAKGKHDLLTVDGHARDRRCFRRHPRHRPPAVVDGV